MKEHLNWLAAVLLLAFCLIPGCAPAEGEFPELNEAGFLDEGEFVYENAEEGIWRYASDVLRVEIFRRENEKPAQVWYEAEVFCAEGSEGPRMIANNPEHWARSKEYPYKIARRNGTVLALSSDYAQDRAGKARGVIIRNGRIISDKSWPANSNHFPNLDCLAIWPDGRIAVFECAEKKAQEYLDEGVTDVLSFGPWLIREGELNEAGLKKYGKSTAQRAAIGMVEKGHYFFMMLEGRITRSRGAGISFLAEKLLEKGCTEAFNLDGGQTASIVFMGHQLCKMDNRNRNLSSRKTSDILGVGHSDLLPGERDPW